MLINSFYSTLEWCLAIYFLFCQISNENKALASQLEAEKLKSDRYLLKYQQAESYKTFAEQKEGQLKKAEAELAKFE